jgi:hypothetical protein
MLNILKIMKKDLLSERINDMIPGYEQMFSERGGITPSDPLKFHLYHLARYWSRLVGFCSQDPSKPEVFIDGDLGACVKVGSDYAHKLIEPSSPIYELWQDCWRKTQSILHDRPVTIKNVEDASQAFNDCLVGLKYDPWNR